MGNASNEENWAVRSRLRWVELWLWWRGHVGRKESMELFGVSAAQASSDLQRYLELNPGGMVYHTSRKRYEATPGMRCVLHEPVFEEGVTVALGEAAGIPPERNGGTVIGERVARVTLPARRADQEVERRVMVALAGGRELRVKYWSVMSGEAKWRKMVPGAVGWDGRRWHARAFCLEREEWRDFVLGRMEKADWPGEAKVPPADKDWLEMEKVRLRIDPGLDEKKRAALRMDYGLKGDELVVETRRAMKRYLLAEMFLLEGQEPHFILGGEAPGEC